jgi:ribosomal protein S18 acetylase RimI-like enzyme
MLDVRPLRMTECDAAGAIVGKNALWRDRYHYSADQAARDLLYATSHGDFVVGAFAPALVGIAWVLPKGAFGRSPYLRLLAVDPEAQSAGAGLALLAHAEANAAKGARHFFLLVSDFNDRAQAFYRQAGYAPVGSLPDFVLPSVAEQLWMKVL